MRLISVRVHMEKEGIQNTKYATCDFLFSAYMLRLAEEEINI